MGAPLAREFFAREPDVVGRALLGCVLVTGRGPAEVAVRLTETEAYQGAKDAASHAFRGRTPRNAVMFGPAGHLYLYFVYGMYWCANIVTGEPGDASAVLLRAGEVIDGLEVARSRRPTNRLDTHLASGPARLAAVLGWGTRDRAAQAYGADLCADLAVGRLFSRASADPVQVDVGPRVGVAAAREDPLRFWIDGDPTVSPYRVHTPRRRSG